MVIFITAISCCAIILYFYYSSKGEETTTESQEEVQMKLCKSNMDENCLQCTDDTDCNGVKCVGPPNFNCGCDEKNFYYK